METIAPYWSDALNDVQILPKREERLEAFEWLAQEVQQAVE